jgi:hypothetical protein
MTKTKHLKGPCQHCGGRLEFPAESIGSIVPCPHCGQHTELVLAAPRVEPAIPSRSIVWTSIALVILVFGLAGSLIALKRAQTWAARSHPRATQLSPAEAAANSGAALASTGAPTQNDFTVSAVTLEKSPDTSLLYAVGTVKNTSGRRRFGIKIDLDLLDAAGQWLGTATDYEQVLEPDAVWHFKALAVDSKATAAKLASIKEDQ